MVNDFKHMQLNIHASIVVSDWCSVSIHKVNLSESFCKVLSLGAETKKGTKEKCTV